MPYIWFLFLCAIWGSSFILMKKATIAFSPVSVGAWRVFGGAVVVGLMWWWRGRDWSVRKSDALSLFVIVLVGFVWPFSIQPYLVSQHGSAFIGMTVSLVPLMTILASIPLLGVRPTRRQLTGVLGALVFMAALLWEGLDRSVPAFDLLLAVSVPTTYAFANAYIRRSLGHISSLTLTFCLLGMSGAVMLPLSLCWSSPGDVATNDLIVAVAALVFLGMVGTGFAQFQFNKLVQEQGPLFAGMVTNLVPLGALMFGWFDNERVTALQVVALVGILSMVLLVQYGAAVVREEASPDVR